MAFSFSSPEEQLAAEMRRRIRAGLWKEKTPGIHKLRREFGLGRTIVEKAVADLVRTGDILHAGHGLPMRINRRAQTKQDPANGTLIVYNIPEYQRSGEIPALIDELCDTLPGPAERLRINSTEPVAATIERLRAAEVKHVVTIGIHSDVAESLIAEGRSVAAIGGPGDFNRAPMVRIDFELLVRDAFRHVFALGHTRVTLPIWRRHPESVRRMRGWIREEYERAGLRHNPEFDTPIIEDEKPEAMHECIRALFRHTPPSALVLLDFPQWIATMTTLNGLRRRVPEDVSILLLARAAEITAATPSVAHFRHPNSELVDAVRRILRTPDITPGIRSIPPVWVPGGSLAAPTRRE